MKLALSLFLIAVPAIGLAEQAPGVVRVEDFGQADRPLALTIWYPSGSDASGEVGGNAVFEGAPVAPDAPITDGVFPLVIASHGGLRSADDSGAWLSAALADAGMIVVEVNGPRAGEAGQALDEIWRRPRDIQRALNAVLSDPDWAGRVDRDHVSAVGFALGGTAGLASAIAEIDPEPYVRSCDAGGPEGPDCAWFARQGVRLADVDGDRLAALSRDPRLTSVVAIEPEYPAVWAEGVDTIGIQATVIFLGDPTLPFPDQNPLLEISVIGDAEPSDAFAVCPERGVAAGLVMPFADTGAPLGRLLCNRLPGGE